MKFMLDIYRYPNYQHTNKTQDILNCTAVVAQNLHQFLALILKPKHINFSNLVMQNMNLVVIHIK